MFARIKKGVKDVDTKVERVLSRRTINNTFKPSVVNVHVDMSGGLTAILKSVAYYDTEVLGSLVYPSPTSNTSSGLNMYRSLKRIVKPLIKKTYRGVRRLKRKIQG